MRKLVIIFAALMCLALTACAEGDGKEDDEKSYNYQRGKECWENEDYKQAIDYFRKEVDENPENASAWSYLSTSYYEEEQLGESLNAINKAIKNIPKKKKAQLSTVYNTRANIYEALGDTFAALDDYGTAIKLNPEDIDNYKRRGELYFGLNRIEESDEDYQKVVELAPGDKMGHLGLGRNASWQKDYDYAIEKFSYVMKLQPDFSDAWAFRAQSYRLKKEYMEAADDAITALNMDYSPKANYELRLIAESAFDIVEIKVKAQQKSSPQESMWPYMLASIHQDKGNHAEAMKYYLEASKLDDNPLLLNWASLQAEEMGYYDHAISLVTQAYERDTTSSALLEFRSRMENNAGYIELALADINRFIDQNPEDPTGYYQRGWIKDKNHVSEADALDDYSTAILLDPEQAYNYLSRGQLYLKQGKVTEARSDFEKVIELDTFYTDDHPHAAELALCYLGRKDESKAWMDSILVHDKAVNNLYAAACIYSLMNELDTSIDYLRKAFEGGFRGFVQIRRDDELNNVRQHPAFAPLIQKYEAKHKEDIKGLKGMEEKPIALKSAEIPFTRENGVCRVNCSINGLPLYFVFDTGASDVTLSMVEANFMLKNNYLSSQDLSGSRYFMTADGSISEGTSVVLKEVDFGGVTLHNVRASVVKNQKAPLLLGQSVLQRLGRIEIDNDNRRILVNNGRE